MMQRPRAARHAGPITVDQIQEVERAGPGRTRRRTSCGDEILAELKRAPIGWNEDDYDVLLVDRFHESGLV
jgi:hypothetical protein